MRSESVLKSLSSWSGREELSDELMRLLGNLPEGCPDFASCLDTASRIDIADDDSWYNEWLRAADEAALVADANVCAEVATAKWQRAISYYQAATVPLDSSDPRQHVVTARMRSCARAFLRRCEPAGEIVTIPWLADYALQGYFLRASSGEGRAPTVIAIGEPGRRKEADLVRLAGPAAERGLSLLVVDLLGEASETCFDEIVGRRDLETALHAVMDYVSDRDDVDDGRVAVVSDDWGSSFVARGIAYDNRYAAAVCDAGLWDMHEQAFMARRLGGVGDDISDARALISESRVVRHISCPVLVTMPERGWLCTDAVKNMVAEMKRVHPDITLKIFAGGPGNPTVPATAIIFDWIAARLGRTPKLQS